MQTNLQKTDWRHYLTNDEFDEVFELLGRSERLNDERKKITDRLNRIRNNCAQRRRSAIGNLSD